ncbi:MAG TPA: rhomboid family intramembrane serine protease [Polyangiaceae bacterium]
MERLLARLERSIGRFAIPNLITFIVAGMGLVYAMQAFAHVDVMPRITLDMGAVLRGEVWRLVTFLFIPMGSSLIWVLVNLYFTWWVGSSLEQHWGAFKFNAFYLIGVLGTIAAAALTGPQTNFWLDASLFLAFATTFPEVQILLFFILPIRVKWLGIVAALGIAAALVLGDWTTRGAIVAAVANYLLFFGGHWWDVWKSRNLQVRQRARRVQFESEAPVFGNRTCAICGAREADGTDIRVCSCEKCGGKPRTLCLEHARNH